jgi:hypothetical protein
VKKIDWNDIYRDDEPMTWRDLARVALYTVLLFALFTVLLGICFVAALT